MADRTTVDVLSLEDFKVTLAHRLSEAEAIVRKLGGELSGRPPALGRFSDGTDTAGTYEGLRSEFNDRAGRLRSAIAATGVATDAIMGNYRTTEARNAATAAEIARSLGGVDEALNGG